MYNRIIGEKLNIPAFQGNILILGPRQVGKSTLARFLNPEIYVNLAREDKYIAYLAEFLDANPNLAVSLAREDEFTAKGFTTLRRRLSLLKKPCLVVVDEVQKLPRLLNEIQVIIDESQVAHRFILIGSSARNLKIHSTNLLPGKVILCRMDPLMVSEIESGSKLESDEVFNLDRALQVGMLPGIYSNEISGSELLRTYAELYLREEIRAEGLVRNVGNFARFLDLVALVSGQWLNYAKLSSDSEIPKETIRRFLSILEDTFLVFRIPSFSPKVKTSRIVSQKDKIFLFDCGVRNALLGLHEAQFSSDQLGLLFEQWLIQQVFYLNNAYNFNFKLSSFLTAGGAEVDLVIERENDILGVEIKWGKQLRTGINKGLNSLQEVIGNYKPLKKIIVYRGEFPQLISKDILALPYLEFLSRLKSKDTFSI